MGHTGQGEYWGGGSGTQKFVYQKWCDKMVPMVIFIFSHEGHFGLGGRGIKGGGGASPPPMVYSHSTTSGGGGGAMKAK